MWRKYVQFWNTWNLKRARCSFARFRCGFTWVQIPRIPLKESANHQPICNYCNWRYQLLGNSWIGQNDNIISTIWIAQENASLVAQLQILHPHPGWFELLMTAMFRCFKGLVKLTLISYSGIDSEPWSGQKLLNVHCCCLLSTCLLLQPTLFATSTQLLSCWWLHVHVSCWTPHVRLVNLHYFMLAKTTYWCLVGNEGMIHNPSNPSNPSIPCV